MVTVYSGKTWGGYTRGTRLTPARVLPTLTDTLMSFLQGQAWQEDPRPLLEDPENIGACSRNALKQRLYRERKKLRESLQGDLT